MSSYNSGTFKQDMPPPGGYKEIPYKRIPAQRIIGYKSAFFASCMLTAYGFLHYSDRRKQIRRMRADLYDYFVSIEPLALAEQDRAFLRQLRHNRNVERDLMKNVPDWKVGTLWGKPVYQNKPEQALPSISLREFYAHRGSDESFQVTRPNMDVGMEDCYDN